MSVDIHNCMRGVCLDCGECPSYICLSARVLCDYCGCPPARHERLEEDLEANLKVSYNLRLSSNIGTIPTQHLVGKSPSLPQINAATRKLKEAIPQEDKSTRTRNIQAADKSSRTRDVPAAEKSIRTLNKMGINMSRNTLNRRRSSLVRRRSTVPEMKMPLRLTMVLDKPRPDRQTEEHHGWNEQDKSLNIYVKTDNVTVFHRHPVAQSTDCIRGRAGYERGLHAFEITWRTRMRGTHAVVGVATEDAPLHAVGYLSLVGSDEHSWGWDLVRSQAAHDDKTTLYPSSLTQEDTFVVPDKMVMVLDMDAGTLAFVVDGQYLGVAHEGLKGKKLFPIVSTVWGHCEIGIKYLGGQEPEPLPLMDLCRHVIRQQIGKKDIDKGGVQTLLLPKPIIQFIEYKKKE